MSRSEDICQEAATACTQQLDRWLMEQARSRGLSVEQLAERFSLERTLPQLVVGDDVAHRFVDTVRLIPRQEDMHRSGL